jgi:hypothetical protein
VSAACQGRMTQNTCSLIRTVRSSAALARSTVHQFWQSGKSGWDDATRLPQLMSCDMVGR